MEVLTIEDLGVYDAHVRNDIVLKCAGGGGTAEVDALFGDTLWRLAVLKHCKEKLKTFDAGKLSKLVDQYLNESAQANVARALRLDEILKPATNKPATNSGTFSSRELSTAFEALVFYLHEELGSDDYEFAMIKLVLLQETMLTTKEEVAECPLCNLAIKKKNLKKHQAKKCNRRMKECPKCSKSMLAEALTHHRCRKTWSELFREDYQ
jgi:dsRNA-specific ribonuclease